MHIEQGRGEEEGKEGEEEVVYKNKATNQKYKPQLLTQPFTNQCCIFKPTPYCCTMRDNTPHKNKHTSNRQKLQQQQQKQRQNTRL